MKRRAAALLCAIVLLLEAVPAASALEGEARRAADTLLVLGLLPAAETRLDEPAVRLDAVALLVRLSGLEPSAGGSVFRDVPAEYAGYAACAAAQGWVAGTAPDLFSPENPLTANAWFTMLLRMLGYRDAEGDFTVGTAALFARRIGLASRAYEGTLTRGDLMETARDALRFPYRDDGVTVIARLTALGRCAAATVSALGLDKPELTLRQAADRHLSAVFRMALYHSDDAFNTQTPDAEASGFFIASDGTAVTNYHSIDKATRAVVTLITGEAFPVERVLWYDADIDLAVIRVSRTSTAGTAAASFARLEIAGTADARPGDVVYTLSNPLGMALAVSSGVISATGIQVNEYALPCIMNTADISQGSSGGALINVYGRVLAVTSGAFRGGNNMYLAVPADLLQTLDLSGPGETLAEVAAAMALRAENASYP